MILTKQKEIWLIDFNPSVGNEIQKLRPAVIIDDDSLTTYAMRMVVPVTTWQDRFSKYSWHLKIAPNNENNLKNISSFNIQQTRYASVKRFYKKVGIIDNNTLNALHLLLITFLNPHLEVINS